MPMLGGTRVLVTGGAGFIGSALVRQLAGAGASVVVVDNLVNGKRENLAEVEGPRVRVVVDDIRNVELMRSLVQGVDCVFHLACLGVRHSLHAPRESHDVNAAATLDLLGIARAAGVGRLVCVSTSEVYGTARWAPMTEEHPTFPMTVYGAAKLAGECYARAYWETYRFPTVVVRPFNAYGPRCHHEGDAGEVIPKFVLRAMAGLPLIIFGDGSQTRDFTYVEDTAAGILKVGFANDAVGRTINIGFRGRDQRERSRCDCSAHGRKRQRRGGPRWAAARRRAATVRRCIARTQAFPMRRGSPSRMASPGCCNGTRAGDSRSGAAGRGDGSQLGREAASRRCLSGTTFRYPCLTSERSRPTPRAARSCPDG